MMLTVTGIAGWSSVVMVVDLNSNPHAASLTNMSVAHL